jgi:hypothetical protein
MAIGLETPDVGRFSGLVGAFAYKTNPSKAASIQLGPTDISGGFVATFLSLTGVNSGTTSLRLPLPAALVSTLKAGGHGFCA